MKRLSLGATYITTIIYTMPKRQASKRNKKKKLKTLPIPQVPWKYVYFITFIDDKNW